MTINGKESQERVASAPDVLLGAGRLRESQHTEIEGQSNDLETKASAREQAN